MIANDQEKKKKRPSQRGILTKIAFAMGAPLLFGVLGLIAFAHISRGTSFIVPSTFDVSWNADEFLMSYGITLFVFSLFSLIFYYFAVRSSRWFILPFIVHAIVTTLAIPLATHSLQNPHLLLSSITLLDTEYRLFRDKQLNLERDNLANLLVVEQCSFVGEVCQIVGLITDMSSAEEWGETTFNMSISPDHEAALRITSDTGICFDLDTRIFHNNTNRYYKRTLPTDCTILDPYSEQ